ncbi:MAG: diguanylate cyclase [Solirubrobacteraceae bacterium]
MEDELTLREQMIGAGVWLSVVLIIALGCWIAATWSQPHRGALCVIGTAAALATGVIAAVPRRPIVRGRYREAFFLSWSMSLVLLITVGAALDRGVRSPIVLLLFLTLVYAALSYPRWAVAVVSGTSLLAVLVLSAVAGTGGHGPSDPIYLIGLMLTLATTGVMCIWQARIQQDARAKLARLSRADPLTGCLNRLGFTERLAAALGGMGGGITGPTLVLLDFDDFKAVNDAAGHSAGDELLCWATAQMASALRPGDALGRLGGDEFAVLLPDSDADHGARIADRLRLALSSRISASVGVASAPADGHDADALHQRADERLYAAKRQSPSSARRRSTNSRSSASIASSIAGAS